MLHSRLKFEQKCAIFETELFVEKADINIFLHSFLLFVFFSSSSHSYEA